MDFFTRQEKQVLNTVKLWKLCHKPYFGWWSKKFVKH